MHYLSEQNGNDVDRMVFNELLFIALSRVKFDCPVFVLRMLSQVKRPFVLPILHIVVHVHTVSPALSGHSRSKVGVVELGIVVEAAHDAVNDLIPRLNIVDPQECSVNS